jgi:hypothetical protein
MRNEFKYQMRVCACKPELNRATKTYGFRKLKESKITFHLVDIKPIWNKAISSLIV